MDPMGKAIRPFNADPLDITECSGLIHSREPSPSGDRQEEASAYVFGQNLTPKDPANRLIYQNSRDSLTPSPVHGKPSRFLAYRRTTSGGSSSPTFSNPASIGPPPSAEVDFCIHELESMALRERRSSACSSLIEFLHSDPISSPVPEEIAETRQLSGNKKIAASHDLSLTSLKSQLISLRHKFSLDESTSKTIKMVEHEDPDNPFRLTHIEAVTLNSSSKPTVVRRRREIKPDHVKQVLMDFLKEQQIHASLNHLFIVQYLGCDIVETDGKLYLDTYTAYAGESASSFFQKHPGMPPSQFIPLICQLFSALSYLASKGVIHRDISPENILINGNQLCLIDFELAYSHDFPNPVSLHFMQGNLLYMAPELSRGEKATNRSDTYGAAMTTLRLMAHIGLIDRNQVRKNYSHINKQWHTPSAQLLPPGQNTSMEHWQMYKDVLDILNQGINDDPAKRPPPLEIEQRLNQVLISATGSESLFPVAYYQSLPTSTADDNSILTALVPGNGNSGNKR